jgi:hypothetical protein
MEAENCRSFRAGGVPAARAPAAADFCGPAFAARIPANFFAARRAIPGSILRY